jgi:amidase
MDVVAQPVDGAAVAGAFRTIWGYLARDVAQGAAARLGAGRADELLEPWTRDLAAWGSAITHEDTDCLYDQVGRAGDAMALLFTRYDLVLSPVLRAPAVAIGELAPDRAFDHIMACMFDYVSYTPLHNLAGLPAISLPLHHGDERGVPIGSMFAAARGREGLLLELALQLETASPWAGRWPANSIAAIS